MATNIHKIIIVGGGFGGVRTARALAKNADTEVTLISDEPDFAYYPQLYHAATGGSRSEATLPLIALLEQTGTTIVIDKVVSIDPHDKSITCDSGNNYHYDQIVFALGTVTNFFDIKGLKEFAYDIKTINGAVRFKSHLHHEIIGLRKPELHYVVIGGGSTGVELAAALVEYLNRIIRLHQLKVTRFSVDLVEAAPRILPHSSESFSKNITKRLKKIGVHVMTGTPVEAETADELIIKGKPLQSHSVVWTSGVSNNPFFAENNKVFTLSKNGKVQVNKYLEGYKDVYVIGDSADTQYSGLAQTAVNDANYVAKDIARKIKDKLRKPYKQKQPSTVTPVGAGWAAAQIGKIEIYGYLAWLIRRVADLIGYLDIESPFMAIKVWLKESTQEDDCLVCVENEKMIITK